MPIPLKCESQGHGTAEYSGCDPFRDHAPHHSRAFTVIETLDPATSHIPARHCSLCQKRLAAMNHGVHCFACSDMAQERMLQLKDQPQQRIRKPKRPIRVVSSGPLMKGSDLWELFSSVA